MDKKVVIIKGNTYKYDKEIPFRPSELYPESIFSELGDSKNEIYEMVREGFHLMDYDKKHYNTKDWNPLGDVITSGMNVLLKPNLVMDYNGNKSGGTDCLYTQPSVVAAVLDYAIIALKGEGTIIVADAPMQSCDFVKLMENSGYKTMIEWYNEKLKGTNIKLAIYDLRELRSKFVNSVLVYTTERYEYTGKGGVIVDLNADSEFFGMNARNYENIRITYYDPAILKKYHNAEVNEYKIAKEILEADVIINMPKPKVHRMAGTTVSLKNLVGINSRKEYLPHHINGSPDEGGDQYMYDSLWKIINNKLTDVRNYQMQTNKNISLGWILTQLVRITSRLARWFSKDHYNNGMWYGNDTISKTIVDLNRILFYANKNGIMQLTKQRKEIIVADMIISGEKEGPVAPSPKNVGMIAIGDNPVFFDEIISYLMGIKMEYAHTIIRAKSIKTKFPLVDEGDKPILISNDVHYNNRYLEELKDEDLLYFIPSSGWEEAFKIRTEII